MRSDYYVAKRVAASPSVRRALRLDTATSRVTRLCLVCDEPRVSCDAEVESRSRAWLLATRASISDPPVGGRAKRMSNYRAGGAAAAGQ